MVLSMNDDTRGGLPGISGWRELYFKEDWWAIWLGLGIILFSWFCFGMGTSISWLAVAPPKWTGWEELADHFSTAYPRYLTQFSMWLAVFSLSMKIMGYRLRELIPSFIFLYFFYFFSIIIISIGAWKYASAYNLEAPLLALLLGLLVSNFIGLPQWMDAGFRVEYYIKTGIVLLGATLPFTLIMWAGPVAIVQATTVSIATFLVIFFTGRRLGLDRRLCATLGAGGAVCGVSASIAVAGAVGAKKEHFLFLVHRADNQVSGTCCGRQQAILGIYRRCGGKCTDRLHLVRADIRQLLVKLEIIKGYKELTRPLYNREELM
jgi:hypothetical protein